MTFRNISLALSILTALALSSRAAAADRLPAALQSALEKAGDNQSEFQQALSRAPAEHAEGMRFLVEHMPARDLKSLSADFLLENVHFAYRAWKEAPWKDRVPKEASRAALRSLKDHLSTNPDKRPKLDEQEFAHVGLTREHAEDARRMLWKDHAKVIRRTRQAEMKARRLKDGEHEMPFYYEVFGKKPRTGRSLFISLHGGGGAPKRVNDRQWENQKRLYRPSEGIYLVPRAPTNAWNLWHQRHIDGMFDRLIENLVALEGVDPNRVYLMGYSAGGDGVYQLAPRMADRWAAAAMMAGHPNETSPLGLRNVPFAIHVGGRDSAYNRNKVAGEWEKKLADLRKADPGGYIHEVKIYPDKGHWLGGEDAAALPWMARHRRDPFPSKVVWKQDDVTHPRFYWLAVEGQDQRPRAEVVASYERQRIDVESSAVDRLIIRLSDRMLDMDKPITVTRRGEELYRGRVDRTIAVLAKTLRERGDPESVFSGELAIGTSAASE